MMRLQELVADLRGRYCWQVVVGRACLLSMELGPPHLEVAEERIDGLAHRAVSVRGTWQLALHECAFRLVLADREVTEGHEADALEDAARRLDGQALLEVIDDAPATRFHFDLGAVLHVEPMAELGADALLWVLGRAGERPVGRRADGTLTRL